MRPGQSGRHPGDNGRGAGYGRYPHVYAGYPGAVPFGYGYPFAYGLVGNDPSGSDQAGDNQSNPSPAPPESVNPAFAEPQPDQELASGAAPVFRPMYRPSYEGSFDSPPVKTQPATTLIFRDGRPPQSVHNYALTGNMLYALDGDARQEISLSLIDIPATVEANRAAGVDFALPVSH
jgi:hypothetical protein